jgi:hypothetical protein
LDFSDYIRIPEAGLNFKNLPVAERRLISIISKTIFSDYIFYQFNLPVFEKPESQDSGKVSFVTQEVYCDSTFLEKYFSIAYETEGHPKIFPIGLKMDCSKLPYVDIQDPRESRISVIRNAGSTFTVIRLSVVRIIYYTVDVSIPTILDIVDIYENFEFENRGFLMEFISYSSLRGVAGLVSQKDWTSGAIERFPIFASRGTGLVIMEKSARGSTAYDGNLQFS